MVGRFPVLTGETEEVTGPLVLACGRGRGLAALDGVGSVVAWLSCIWWAFLFLSNVILFAGVSMIGELGGLLAVQCSSPRCKRLWLLQRQDGGLLLSLLGTWMMAGPVDWLRVFMVVVVWGELVLDSMGLVQVSFGSGKTRVLWFVNWRYERDKLQDEPTVYSL